MEKLLLQIQIWATNQGLIPQGGIDHIKEIAQSSVTERTETHIEMEKASVFRDPSGSYQETVTQIDTVSEVEVELEAIPQLHLEDLLDPDSPFSAFMQPWGRQGTYKLDLMFLNQIRVRRGYAKYGCVIYFRQITHRSHYHCKDRKAGVEILNIYVNGRSVTRFGSCNDERYTYAEMVAMCSLWLVRQSLLNRSLEQSALRNVNMKICVPECYIKGAHSTKWYKMMRKMNREERNIFFETRLRQYQFFIPFVHPREEYPVEIDY